MTSPADVELTRRYRAALDLIRTRYGDAAAKQWDLLPGYDEANIPGFVDAITDVSTAARSRAADLTTGYLARLTGTAPRAATLTPVDLGAEMRPAFMATWHNLATGVQYAEAVQAGSTRLLGLAATILTRTAAETLNDAGTEAGVVGYRRVTSGKTCVWCATVATQRYRSADSADAPRHDHCNCTVVPILGESDPGRVINRPVLDALGAHDSPYVTADGRPAERSA